MGFELDCASLPSPSPNPRHLKFENQNDETEEPVGPEDSLLGKLELPEGPEEKAPAAEVVSLDSFRK